MRPYSTRFFYRYSLYLYMLSIVVEPLCKTK
nr:MAG TPA: hypothetical protein [Caudoviricetes sp.]